MLFASMWPNGPERMILTAEAEDFAPMAALHASAFARGWQAEEFAAMEKDPAVSLLVARRVGARPGHLDGFNVVRQAADEGEILSIVVDPAQRGSGLGLSLMRDAIRRFQTDRLRQVFLEVAKDNTPAIALYRRLGFETVGERRGYYPEMEEKPKATAPKQETSLERSSGPQDKRTALVMRLGLV